jgi:hypothetical protein
MEIGEPRINKSVKIQIKILQMEKIQSLGQHTKGTATAQSNAIIEMKLLCQKAQNDKNSLIVQLDELIRDS